MFMWVLRARKVSDILDSRNLVYFWIPSSFILVSIILYHFKWDTVVQQRIPQWTTDITTVIKTDHSRIYYCFPSSLIYN